MNRYVFELAPSLVMSYWRTEEMKAEFAVYSLDNGKTKKQHEEIGLTVNNVLLFLKKQIH